MAKKRQITRRVFIIGTASALAGCATAGTQRITTRRVSPNEKLNIAAIGSGGKGNSDIAGCARENIVALCDVDDNNAAEAYNRYTSVPKFRDFRQMIDKEGKNIDAVIVSTPDHTHAVAAMYAIRNGKHVYVQKPLTHTVYEARMLTEAAREYGVATQMGNQGHSGRGVRELAEMIWSGAIGQVKEVHVWTNRPVWPQGIDRPAGSDPVPDNLSWDLWLGPMPERPYVSIHPATNRPAYHPFVWRGWWDFGCGALGDMACHIMDPAFYCMNLGYPESVELVRQEGMTSETGPKASIIKYHFAEREGQGKLARMQAVDVYWYDGGLLPERPADIPADEQLGDGRNGSLFIGTDGYLTTGEYGGDSRMVPASKARDYKAPDPWLPRIQGSHYDDWIQACKGGEPACSNFDYSGPFTETVLFGNLAIRAGGKVMWDGANFKTDRADANALLHTEYRQGWEL